MAKRCDLQVERIFALRIVIGASITSDAGSPQGSDSQKSQNKESGDPTPGRLEYSLMGTREQKDNPASGYCQSFNSIAQGDFEVCNSHRSSLSQVGSELLSPRDSDPRQSTTDKSGE